MPADPWLSQRMADYAQIRRAENTLHPAVRNAVDDFLATARTSVGTALAASGTITFAQDDHDEPDPPGLPPESAWNTSISRFITPVVRSLWSASFGRVANRDAPDDDAGHTAGIFERLAGFRRQVADRLRRTLQAGRDKGETPAQLKERAAALMTLENWDGQVMTMTRTETMAALNAGAFHGALTEQERTGEKWEKRWQATDDQRVRHTHHTADGQVRPLHDPFAVGDAALQFPGDPRAPAGEVINCRCACRYAPAGDASLTAASAPPGGPPMSTPTPTTGPVQVSPSGRWRGPLGFMDQWSADQRMLAAPEDGVRCRPLPLPLLVQGALANGHDGGRLGESVIDRIWVDGNTVMGEGRFDMDDPAAAQLARKVGLGFVRFVSLDVDDATSRQVLIDADGNIVPDGDPADPSLAIGDVYSGWRVMGATLLAHPAFPDAQIALADDDGQAMTASAFADIVGYNPDWGCVKPDGDAWAPTDCEDPDAQPANPTGDGPFDPEQAPDGDTQDVAAATDTAAPADDDKDVAPPPEDITADDAQAAEELDPNADADSAGCVVQNDDGTWSPAACDAPGAQPANPGGDGPAEQAAAALAVEPPADAADAPPADDAPAAGPTHAGIALKAADTGRVLLLQRALDDTDPASGMWEFPGGGIEPDETPMDGAAREFREETGMAIPEDASPAGGWTSPDGVYQCFIVVIPTEAELPINPDHEDRAVLNPDDPDGDNIETVAWWAIDHLPESNTLREEVRDTPWDKLAAAGTDAQGTDDTPEMAELAATPDDCEPCQAVTITAAAAGTMAPGWTPPADWFEAPAASADGAYSIRVDQDGRVFGYLAAWGSCHVGYRNRCVPPPRSATDYSYFNIRPVRTSTGTVYCGLLTMDTGHANLAASAQSALAHYDNTGTQAAVVRVGEDNHGIWAVGAVLPFITEEQRLKLSLASFSGDWREIRGGVELIAALAVNSPGFPLAAKKTGADNRPYALVAAGALPAQEPDAPTEQATPEPLVANPQVDPLAFATVVLEVLDARDRRRARVKATTATIATFRADAEQRAAAATARRVALARGKVVRVQRPKAVEPPMELVGLGGPMPRPSTQDIGLARNWVDEQGGLPAYIKRIADHLTAKGMDTGRAIATAVNAAKKMCSSPDGLQWPGIQHINPGSKAEACAAVTKWEAMKAAARAS